MRHGNNAGLGAVSTTVIVTLTVEAASLIMSPLVSTTDRHVTTTTINNNWSVTLRETVVVVPTADKEHILQSHTRASGVDFKR